MTSKYRIVVLLVTMACLSFQPCGAADLFSINAVTVDSLPPVALTVGDSSFPDLISSAIKAQDQFAVFGNRASTSVLNYAGVQNAMRVTVNATGTQADFAVPIIGYQRVFTGPNRDAIEDQIEAFLKNDGADVYRRFLEAINRSSLVAVSDGNPNSTTARTADTIFRDAGFGGTDSVLESLHAGDIGQRLTLGLMGTLGSYRAGGFEGDSYSIPLSFGYEFNPRVSAKFSVPLVYQEVEGSKIYQGGFITNVPVKVIGDGASGGSASPWRWEVTPTVGLAAGGSADYAAGSMMMVGALTSMLSYDFGSFKLTMGNHVSVLEGIAMDVGGYDVGGDVSQQIVKNGLKVSVPFLEKWVAELYAICTNFLQDASVQDYYTVGAQVGYRLFGGSAENSGVVIVGIVGDLGNGYDSFEFKLGTGFTF
jgi:hypothetical protein